jgi:hypothetical protein
MAFISGPALNRILRVEPEPLVERRFDFCQALLAAESRRTGDKEKLLLVFGGTDELLQSLRATRRWNG